MDSIWLEYGWTLLVLIGLEGLLSADNALVLAVIAKHLPDDEKKRAISYGIIGAFAFRFAAIFAISFLANVWQVQAIGAIYLIYLGLKHVFGHYFSKKKAGEAKADNGVPTGKGFWPTVAKIGLADLAFAIDSILAAVALALALPDSPLPAFGGMDGAKFTIVVLAGLAGLILIKYAATWFVQLLDVRPGLETTAYLIVAWVGVKLGIITLSHERVNVLPNEFPESLAWTLVFWGVLLGTAIGGWFLSGKPVRESNQSKHEETETKRQKAAN
ncbi:TerC family protein [Aquibacillus salsiterrae]|uniref:TerC family protein n=1 Tax=Aquibacillus salsiterrae TaxID=2950439 RepID=A0A9X4ADU2_9BACI|nr:TerC family protein [Aquibacillus salsiterrae]MDC3415871.1 TerC family protein [Aquibacillus salsiterrae]